MCNKSFFKVESCSTTYDVIRFDNNTDEETLDEFIGKGNYTVEKALCKDKVLIINQDVASRGITTNVKCGDYVFRIENYFDTATNTFKDKFINMDSDLFDATFTRIS